MATSAEAMFSSSLPELYERFLVGPLFRPFAQELLDRATLGENVRVLDVACGTGIVARLARERLGDRGRIVGVDASPGMIAMARAVAPAIDWRDGDAAHLPVRSDEMFDVVSCHQGLQFFSDKTGAIREMHRVLAPRGRLVVATWLATQEIPLIRDLERVAERHLGPIVDQRHSLPDAAVLRRLLADGGFNGISVETITHKIRMSDPAIFPRLNTMALVAMNPAAKSMSDEERKSVSAAITNESIEAVQPYLVGSDLVWQIGSNVAIAKA